MWCDGGVSDPAAGTGVDPAHAQLGRFAVDLARGAGQVVRQGAEATIATTSKSTSTDLVTDVDRASELWLVEQILALRPHDAILGEEGGERPGTSGVRWLLDPIDGTVNFVLRLPAFAVSVAAEVEGTVVAGAVCNPLTDEIFRATRGSGAWLGDLRLHGPRDVPLERAVVGTGFGYDRARRERQGRVAARLLPLVADLRRIGSAALDLCAVAAGRLDAYFEAGLNPWDYAAGALIAVEAGCSVSGLRGRAPDDAFVAAAGPSLAGDFYDLLERLGADEVL